MQIGKNKAANVGAVSDVPPGAAAQRAPTVRQAPLGLYAQPTLQASVGGAIEPRLALLEDKAAPRGDRLRSGLELMLAGAEPKLDPSDLRALQSAALNTVQRLFTNEFGDDAPLKDAVGRAQASLQGDQLDGATERQIFAGRSIIDKQLDALTFVLRTFRGNGDADTNLRRVAMWKLGQVGRQRDLAAILPYVRKGNSSDLYHGLAAIKGITSRAGSPEKRGRLSRDPVIGPLLQKDRLTQAEQTQVIEAVLQHGSVKSVDKLHGGSNFNDVFFVTFAEKIPGADGKKINVRGVFKPERTWADKDRAFFSREVSAYEFDRSFAKSGLIPPTVEAMIPLGEGKTAEIGSLQYMIPNSKPLGYRHRVDGHERWTVLPEFEATTKTPEFAAQMSRCRVLLYVLADPDKLESNVKPLPNLANFMVDDQHKLWMIDNAYSQGAAPRPTRQILPDTHDGEVLEHLRESLADGGQQIRGAMGTYIEDADAAAVAKRTEVATYELSQRPVKK